MKKVTREYRSLRASISEEDLDSLFEELIDIFIYVLKGAAELF